MGRVVVVALLLVIGGCSRRAAGVGIIGGGLTTIAGITVFTATAESEGGDGGPAMGAVIAGVGVIWLLAALAGALSEPEQERPPGAPPLPPADARPKPPPVDGTEELRSHKRVAQYMASHGKCDQVLQLSLRVAALDAKFHAASFMTDDAIAKCLEQTPPP